MFGPQGSFDDPFPNKNKTINNAKVRSLSSAIPAATKKEKKIPTQTVGEEMSRAAPLSDTPKFKHGKEENLPPFFQGRGGEGQVRWRRGSTQGLREVLGRAGQTERAGR